MKKTYEVTSKEGLHARPASILVSLVSKFTKDDVNIGYQDKTFTLKSMIAVLSLAIPSGGTFTIEAIGPNEVEIINLIEDALKKHAIIS